MLEPFKGTLNGGNSGRIKAKIKLEPKKKIRFARLFFFIASLSRVDVGTTDCFVVVGRKRFAFENAAAVVRTRAAGTREEQRLHVEHSSKARGS